MLRKNLLSVLAVALLGAAAQAETVDEIIAKNLEARGGKDKIEAVRSARITGRMTMGEGMEAPIVLEWKRPGMVRMEFTIQGMTAIQAYDGSSGWMVMPFLGKKDPEKMPADDQKDIEEMADVFEGPLLNYAAKGHQVELIGKEPIEGTEAYKLKLTKKNGDVAYIYLDGDAYLEIKDEGKRSRRGQEIEFESSQGDYKEVGGLMFAHSIEQKPKGVPTSQTISIDKIELNVDLPDARFQMPEIKAEEPSKPSN
jgi:outer membrane lipoprotein-sorting protein